MDQVQAKKFTDINNIWPTIWRRRWLIVLPWLLVTFTVFFGSKLLTPQYRAYSILLIDRDVRLSEELRELLGLGRNYQGDAMREDELRAYRNEIISSQFMLQLATRLKLYQDPILMAQAEKVAATTPGMTKDQALAYVLQDRLAKNIYVNYSGGKQIQISAESADRGLARDITNTLSELFIEECLKEDVTSIRSSQDFSSVQLQKYNTLLENKIKERTDFENSIRQNQLDSSVSSKNNYDQIQLEIDQTKQDISDFQNEKENLISQLISIGVDPNNLTIKDSNTNLKSKRDIKDQLRSVGEMAIKYPWNDPQMLNYHIRQDSLLFAIEDENKRLVNTQFPSLDEKQRGMLARLFTVRDNLDFCELRIDYLRSSLDELKGKTNQISEDKQKLDGLNREIAAITELRDKFAKQQEGSSLSEALARDMSSTKYRIVEPAKLPVSPVRPDRLKISLMGFMLGMIIGLAAALLAELFDTSLKSLDEIEEFIGLPVLAVVPKIELPKHLRSQKQ